MIKSIKYKPEKTPLELLLYSYLNDINESLHVYQKENPNYNDEITDCYNKLITDYFDGILTYKIFDNSNLEYSVFKLMYISPYIDEVQIFLTISDTTLYGDAINLTIPKYKHLCDDYYPIYKGNNRHIELCTLIILLPKLWNIKTPLNKLRNLYLNNQELIGIINHELLHIIHELKDNNLAINAGNAFYYGDLICKSVDINNTILNANELKKLYINNNITDDELILLFGSCIYYTDKSELSAWLETFNNHDLFYYKQYPDNKVYTDINLRKSYITYKLLYNLVNKYKYELIKILDNKKFDDLVKSLIKNWANDMKCNKLYMSNIINKWLLKISNYLSKCTKIHEINCMNNN